MTLGKEASIVADSTMSSSPAHVVDASPQIKRATRTYGKRREEPLVEGTGNSANSSSENIHRTAPPGLEEMIPASSPQKIPVDPFAFDAIMRNDKPGRRHIEEGIEKDSWESNSFSEQEESSSKPKSARTDKRMETDKLISEDGDPQSEQEESSEYTFSWRGKLQEIDKAFEDDVSGSTSSTSVKPKGDLSFGKARLLEDSGAIPPESTRALTPPPFLFDDAFNNIPSHVDAPFLPSSPPAHRPGSRRPRLPVFRDSDSEEELQKGSSSTAPSTSGHNSFVSAKSRLSSTPPTSDEDAPSKISVNPKLRHSRKLDSSRVSVPPLDFTKLSSKEGKRGRKDRQAKIKPPTKKELRDTAKERSRLAAQAKVIVPRIEAPLKYTVENLLKRVTDQQSRSQPSDPIEPFTSPISPASPPKESMRLNPISLERAEVLHPDNADGSEDDLPEITELLREDAKKRYAEDLKRMKRWALEQQTAMSLQDSEGDDLVISTDPKSTIKEEEENRRSKQSKQSMARKRVAKLAHVNPAPPTKKAPIISPNRIRRDFSAIQEINIGSSANLQRILFAQARERASREIRRKEEEWTKHGGHLAQKPVVPVESFESAMKAIAGKGLEIVEAQKSWLETESDNDEEWRSETRGSPATNKDQNDDPETQEIMLGDGDITMVADEQNVDDSDFDDTKAHKSKRNLVLSDSEEEGADLGHPVFRRSPASSGLATEDEHDKENNTKLMYDQGEDKENKRVVRHTRCDIFDITDAALSSSEPSPRNFSLDDVNSVTRRPFQELLPEERPDAKLFPAPGSTQTFVSKLQQASPLAGTLASAPTLKPFLPEGSGFAGFSQFSQVEPGALDAAPLQPGFSELFKSGTERRTKDRFEETISVENRSSTKLKRTDTLDLTQDVVAAIQLQPAFQAEESLVRKADSIFEKEQAFVIEVNMKKVARQGTELYVNELGFLTQTRPLDGTPEVYRRLSPASGLVTSWTETPSQRMPLQTLSLSSPLQFESPNREAFRRLRRVIDTPPRTGASPPVQQLDAHEILLRGQQAQRRNEKIKRKRAELSNLLEDEAAESDDDDFFGFVSKPPDDDEDGEDLDQNLLSLVDDRKMDAKTEAPHLVFDKYKEHLEEDDKKLEELHQAAVQGQLRQKRNRGVGIDDSDDDSDVGDNEKARRAMKKARKSDRTDIKGLEAKEETRAFADTYNQCLRDDDGADFAFLEKQHDVDDVIHPHSDTGDEDDNGHNEDTLDGSVETSEVRKTLQKKAQEGRFDENTVDRNDVSWLDKDEEMEDVPRVKSVSSRQGRKSRLDILDWDMVPSRKSPAKMNQTSRQWFTEESKTRNASTARKNGALAVTGHSRKRERVPSKGLPTSGPLLGPVRPIKAAASALSIIADRSSNFA